MIIAVASVALAVGFFGGWLAGRAVFAHEVGGALKVARRELERAAAEVTAASSTMAETKRIIRDGNRTQRAEPPLGSFVPIPTPAPPPARC